MSSKREHGGKQSPEKNRSPESSQEVREYQLDDLNNFHFNLPEGNYRTSTRNLLEQMDVHLDSLKDKLAQLPAGKEYAVKREKLEKYIKKWSDKKREYEEKEKNDPKKKIWEAMDRLLKEEFPDLDVESIKADIYHASGLHAELLNFDRLLDQKIVGELGYEPEIFQYVDLANILESVKDMQANPKKYYAFINKEKEKARVEVNKVIEKALQSKKKLVPLFNRLIEMGFSHKELAK